MFALLFKGDQKGHHDVGGVQPKNDTQMDVRVGEFSGRFVFALETSNAVQVVPRENGSDVKIYDAPWTKTNGPFFSSSRFVRVAPFGGLV